MKGYYREDPEAVCGAEETESCPHEIMDLNFSITFLPFNLLQKIWEKGHGLFCEMRRAIYHHPRTPTQLYILWIHQQSSPHFCSFLNILSLLLKAALLLLWLTWTALNSLFVSYHKIQKLLGRGTSQIYPTDSLMTVTSLLLTLPLDLSYGALHCISSSPHSFPLSASPDSVFHVALSSIAWKTKLLKSWSMVKDSVSSPRRHRFSFQHAQGGNPLPLFRLHRHQAFLRLTYTWVKCPYTLKCNYLILKTFLNKTGAVLCGFPVWNFPKNFYSAYFHL